MDEDGPELLQRPSMLVGCLLFAVLVSGMALLGGFCVVFLESGTDSKAVLEVPEAYEPGSVTFVPEENVYLVRLEEGQFLALSDLDAFNRARPGQRCRVQPIGRADPVLAELLEEHGHEFSPAARGSNFLFRDPCAGTLYDLTGVRVGSPGPNLDRHEVGIDDQDRITIDVATRQCTQREEDDFFAEIECQE